MSQEGVVAGVTIPKKDPAEWCKLVVEDASKMLSFARENYVVASTNWGNQQSQNSGAATKCTATFTFPSDDVKFKTYLARNYANAQGTASPKPTGGDTDLGREVRDSASAPKFSLSIFSVLALGLFHCVFV